jgi:hypothetical protein
MMGYDILIMQGDKLLLYTPGTGPDEVQTRYNDFMGDEFPDADLFQVRRTYYPEDDMEEIE